VREEEALLAIEPDQVRVPVVVSGRQAGEGDGTAADQIEHPPRAARDRRLNLATTLGHIPDGGLR